MTPDKKTVNATLASITRASHPNRELARERIAQFRLDRERENLPVVNAVDSGAPLLDTWAVVGASVPNHAGGVREARSWWVRLLWWR